MPTPLQFRLDKRMLSYDLSCPRPGRVMLGREFVAISSTFSKKETDGDMHSCSVSRPPTKFQWHCASMRKNSRPRRQRAHLLNSVSLFHKSSRQLITTESLQERLYCTRSCCADTKTYTLSEHGEVTDVWVYSSHCIVLIIGRRCTYMHCDHVALTCLHIIIIRFLTRNAPPVERKLTS